MTNEHDDSADDAHEPPVVAAGAQLRAAREALALELPYIAAQTRIPVRHLEAIEDGDFEALPSRAYVIGFSRTFAKAVGLDDGAITAAVRAELADSSLARKEPGAAMEPGDPARLPSAGLAWAGGAAAVVLAIGAFAFYSSYFGAGTEPDSLLPPAPPTTASAAAVPDTPAPAASGRDGEVVLTALEDGVWLRLYEEGGDRLLERTLKQGETVTVPATAQDPRVNIGRPDALGITVGGTSVAKLAERATNLASAPVSAAALLSRAGSPSTGLVNAAAPAVRPAPPASPAPPPAPSPASTALPDAAASSDANEDSGN